MWKSARRTTVYFSILVICLSCGCIPIESNYCDDDEYRCTGMVSTLPYRNPIDLDSYSDVVLFADGSLLKNFGYGDLELFPLRDICASDTICDIIFYDEGLKRRNYSSYNRDIDMAYDEFIIVITPIRCCKMDNFDNVTLEFGESGPDTARLINAISADINYMRRIFIVDSGDNSIKIYDHEGNFVTRWSPVGHPYKVKLFNGNVLVLDTLENSIKRYTFDGEYLDTPLEGYRYDEITAFLPTGDDEFWVSDLGGERLSLISNRNVRYEIHSGYCYWDVTFNIRKTVAMDYGNGLKVVDREGNYLLKFGGIDYF